jgi:hypothetical protein
MLLLCKANLLVNFAIGILIWTFSLTIHALELKVTYMSDPKIEQKISFAAQSWEKLFSDPITVNIQIQFAALGDNTRAHTSAEYVDIKFTQFKQALAADKKSNADQRFFANLPSGALYKKLINGTSESAKLHKDQNYVQSGLDTIELTRANAKALGLIPAQDNQIDAIIVINSSLINPDPKKPNNVIDQVNLQAIIFHEIGHALGFVSGVNILDYFYFYKGATLSHSEYSKFATPLDFTRCSIQSIVAGADMDWTVTNREKHFSIDGKCSLPTRIDNAWSRGVYLGDGFEPGHWRNDSALGVMVPVSTKPLQLSELERLAFDVIGWDLQNQSDKILQKKP